ncbi:unnamed protein product [Alopecurus aequalis]
MATIKASVNLFALLDGDDSGDKRLADFDSQHKDQASALAKKKQAASAAKPKKKPSPPAPAKSKAPTTNPTPAAAAGLRRSYVAASSTATNRQTTTTPTAPAAAGSTNYTALLFGKAYPSARERIFKQRQEEFQKRQARAAENGGGVPSGDDGKSTDAGYGMGKTHGVKVQQGGYDRAKQQQSAAVKEAPAPAPVEEPTVAPVVVQAPPPPSLYDVDQFPTLK